MVALRYSYEGKPPPQKQRLGIAKDVLRETLDRLEKGQPADVGFEEDPVRRIRTDHIEV